MYFINICFDMQVEALWWSSFPETEERVLTFSYLNAILLSWSRYSLLLEYKMSRSKCACTFKCTHGALHSLLWSSYCLLPALEKELLFLHAFRVCTRPAVRWQPALFWLLWGNSRLVPCDMTLTKLQNISVQEQPLLVWQDQVIILTLVTKHTF
jgi:hypothetical protein